MILPQSVPPKYVADITELLLRYRDFTLLLHRLNPPVARAGDHRSTNTRPEDIDYGNERQIAQFTHPSDHPHLAPAGPGLHPAADPVPALFPVGTGGVRQPVLCCCGQEPAHQLAQLFLQLVRSRRLCDGGQATAGVVGTDRQRGAAWLQRRQPAAAPGGGGGAFRAPALPPGAARVRPRGGANGGARAGGHPHQRGRQSEQHDGQPAGSRAAAGSLGGHPRRRDGTAALVTALRGPGRIGL